MECTLYASTAPCPMCAYAIWESGIIRIVYGVICETFAKMIPGDAPYISCEEIYRMLKTSAEITGGVLDDEGIRVYRYWPKKAGLRR